MMERKKNVAEIRRLMQKRKSSSRQHLSISTVTHFLTSKGITPSIAREIATEFIQKGDELTQLEDILAKRIHTTGDLSFDLPQRVALVGPTGIGKTTTLLKLARFYACQKQKSVVLVTFDHRKETLVQLETALSQWKIPLFKEMRLANTYDLMLIDTEGCNFYQPNRVDSIGEQLAVCDEVEVVLTLSSSTKDVDLYGAIHQFSPLQPSSLAFTKLDETLTIGTLINVSTKTDLPIRYITFGYPLPGEIQIANPKKITHKILTDFNHEEFQLLRELIFGDK